MYRPNYGTQFFSGFQIVRFKRWWIILFRPNMVTFLSSTVDIAIIKETVYIIVCKEILCKFMNTAKL